MSLVIVGYRIFLAHATNFRVAEMNANRPEKIFRSLYFKHVLHLLPPSPSPENLRLRFRIRKLATAARVHFSQPSRYLFIFYYYYCYYYETHVRRRVIRDRNIVYRSRPFHRVPTHSGVSQGSPSQTTSFPIHLF